MPIHDWTRVNAGTFHDFHGAWITHIKESLNEGLLPSGYYAMAEQHFNGMIADVLTLHAGEPDDSTSSFNDPRAVAVAEAPPRIRQKMVAQAGMSPNGRDFRLSRPVGAFMVRVNRIPRPSAWAIESCPVGANTPSFREETSFTVASIGGRWQPPPSPLAQG